MRYIFIPIANFFYSFVVQPLVLFIIFAIFQIIMLITGVFRFVWNLENPFEIMEFAKYRSFSVQMIFPFKLTQREIDEIQTEIDSLHNVNEKT